MRKRFIQIISLLTFIFATIGCTEKYSISNNERYTLCFSTDTISFDTIFTTIGSPADKLIIYNRNNYGLKFGAYLGGGSDSPFRINIDGESGIQFSNMEIRDDDSIYCFISATLDKQQSREPIPVTDSLVFILESGITQKVQLLAYGQDIIILRGDSITTDRILTSEYPYYIYDSLTIKENATLYIEPGTSVHIHKNAGIKVYGKIVANGTADSIITFRGGRTDKLFEDLPYDQISDQWRGIHLTTSSYGNIFNHCDIRNSSFGIKADSSNIELLKLRISSSKLHNTTGHALELINCYSETGNSLIANSGGNCINISGGRHSFIFSTIANYYLWGSRNAAISIANNTSDNEFALEKADFINCIITGSSGNEFTTHFVDSINGDTTCIAEYTVQNSLIMVSDTTSKAFSNCLFDNIENEISGAKHFVHIADGDYKFDFRLDSLSSARGIANNLHTQDYPIDIDGNLRPVDTGPDAGCYQYSK